MTIHIWRNLPPPPRLVIENGARMADEFIIKEAKHITLLKFIDDRYGLENHIVHDFWDYADEPDNGHWYRWRLYERINWQILFH